MSISRRDRTAEAGGQGRLSCAERLTSCDSDAGKAKEAMQAEEEGAHCWSGVFWHVECAVKDGHRGWWSSVCLVRSSRLCMQLCRDEGTKGFRAMPMPAYAGE